MKVGREQLTTEPAPHKLTKMRAAVMARMSAEAELQAELDGLRRLKAWLDSEDAECQKMRPFNVDYPYGKTAPVGYGIRVAVARKVRQIVEGK